MLQCSTEIYRGKNGNFDIEKQFPRLDISDRNKGAKIPVQQRKNLLCLAVSRFQDLEDFLARLITLFSGNDSRVYHQFLNDVTKDYTDKTSPAELIDANIKQICESKRKKNLIEFRAEVSAKRVSYIRFQCETRH